GGPADTRRVPAQAGPAVRPGERGRRRRAKRTRRRRRQGRRPRCGVLRTRRLRRGRRLPGVPDLSPPRCPRFRTGRVAHPQLPHRLLRAEAPWPAGGGRDRPGPWRGRRRGNGRAPGGEGTGGRTIAVVSTDEKDKVAREAGADEVVRSDAPWK